LFLDSTILANVCENIFQELNKFIQARNNLIHEDNYVKQWRRLRERVDFVLSELQRSSFDAQDAAQNKLQDWLRGIVNYMQEVPVSRTLVKTPLCLTGRSVIPSCVHPKELNLDWLNKINFKSASTDLELLQRNTVMERENKQLRKELLEQKLLLLEYKTFTEAKLEEARVREETSSCVYLCMFLLLNYFFCFRTYCMLLMVFLISFFLSFILYFLLMTKGGVDL